MNIEVFDEYTQRYEDWFVKNSDLYDYEINAIKTILPQFHAGIEVGIGTGRFAIPLGVNEGIDPSDGMREVAIEKGLQVKKGVVENLPYSDSSKDFVLMVTTICFVDDVDLSFKEINRVLQKDGYFLIAFVDKDTYMGNIYLQKKEDNIFYKKAVFYSSDDVIGLLNKHNFQIVKTAQTLFKDNIGEIKKGYGEGGFVAILAKK